MSEGDRAGWWAVVFLSIGLAAVYFNIFMIAFSVIKQLFWS